MLLTNIKENGVKESPMERDKKNLKVSLNIKENMLKESGTVRGF
jgi:hypothetical protein